MHSIELAVDGAFLTGRLSRPAGTLDAPAVVVVEVDRTRAEAVVDRFGAAHGGFDGFLHRLPRPAHNSAGRPITVLHAQSGSRGSIAWNAGAVDMARWLHDVPVVAADPDPEALPRFARAVVRHLWLHPLGARRNRRSVACLARDAGILLAARGQADAAARLLSAFPVLASLGESDIATYEALRVVADAASWPAKRRLALAMRIAGRRSPTAAGFSARMRLAAGPDTAAVAGLEAAAADPRANPVLRGFAAESLLLHVAGRRGRDA